MRAFVIGNVALDETIEVADLPAPGASIHGRAALRDLGGKGANQAVVLGRAGVRCVFGAAVGDDLRGDDIRARLLREPLDLRLVVMAGVASDFSIVLRTQSGENANITTTESAGGLPPDLAIQMLDGAERGDLLVVQGNLSGPTTLAVLERAKAMGLRTALNPSPMGAFMGDVLRLVDMAFVNEGEAQALGGPDALIAKGVGQVVLTLGPAGARLYGNGVVHVPAHTCRVVDTTGAGDCFMATTLASAHLRGTGLDARALGHAARAAAIAVSRPGTAKAFPTVTEMAAIMAQT